ncbi:hypothetical protein [Nocardia wallacei]|uniref:hypothetical protein n=1 Tax=Nocardia wallacei TaxID=480035 RepID=UPI0024580A55|nr:hypothetical protein [Nocardia wallacei]
MIDPELIAEARSKLSSRDSTYSPSDDENYHFAKWAESALPALLDALEVTQAALERLARDHATELEYIAGKQQRDRQRMTDAIALVQKHAGYELTAKVRAVLEGSDE